MKPPVERVRVSAKGREILIKVKRHTGLEHWNEICRIAFCRSLANPAPPQKCAKEADSNIDIEWKTFAGAFQEELSAVTLIKAQKDGIDISSKVALSDYFRNHLERGIVNLQNVKDFGMLF